MASYVPTKNAWGYSVSNAWGYSLSNEHFIMFLFKIIVIVAFIIFIIIKLSKLVYKIYVYTLRSQFLKGQILEDNILKH